MTNFSAFIKMIMPGCVFAAFWFWVYMFIESILKKNILTILFSALMIFWVISSLLRETKDIL